MQQIVSSFPFHMALSLFFLLLYLYSRILFTHLKIFRSKYFYLGFIDETHTFMLWRQTCGI